MMLNEMGLLDTYASLALPMIFIPLGTFIMTQCFKSVPNSMEQAALSLNDSTETAAHAFSLIDATRFVEFPASMMPDDNIFDWRHYSEEISLITNALTNVNDGSHGFIAKKEGDRMPYRVAICDDSETDSAYVEKLLRDWAKDREIEVIPKIFPSAENFIWHYEEDKRWDILLLDIEMGAMDGVTLAKSVRTDNEAVQIVFITGFPDFMAEGYEVSALHYLMKPVEREKLFSVLDKAVTNLSRREKCLAISFDRETEYVPLGKITYIEAQKQYIIVRTEACEYRMKTSLANAAGELDEYFFKCQRSFIVNLRYVSKIGSESVTLKDGSEVPISRGVAQKLAKEIIRLF